MATATRGRPGGSKPLPANLSPGHRHALAQFLDGQISAGALSAKLAESGDVATGASTGSQSAGVETREFAALPARGDPRAAACWFRP